MGAQSAARLQPSAHMHAHAHTHVPRSYSTVWFWLNRRQAVEEELMRDNEISEDERRAVLAELEKRESDYTRLQRQRMSVDDFEPLTIIGRGAFGEVGYSVFMPFGFSGGHT